MRTSRFFCADLWPRRLGLWVLIVGSAFIIPFSFSNETADPLLTPRFLALALLCSGLFFIVLIQALLPSPHPIRDFLSDPVLQWLTLYLGFSLMALAMAVNLGEGVVQWFKSFLFFAFLYVALLTLDTEPKWIQWLTQWLVVSGIGFSAIGWIQWGFPDLMKIPGHVGIFGTMGNKNLYASALFLFLPFVLFGCFQYQGLWRCVAVVSLIMVGSGILITRTRSVWLAVVLSGILVVLTTPVRTMAIRGLFSVISPFFPGCPPPIPKSGGPPSGHGKGLIRSVVAVVLSGVILVGSHIFLTTDLTSTASMRIRWLLWGKTADMVVDYPVLGVGPGQWKLRLPQYGPMDRQFHADGTTFEVVFQRPHNDFLWMLAETGLPALICMLFFYAILIRRCYRMIRHANDPKESWLAFCMLFGLIGYLVISFFSFPRERIFHNVFLALISAIILSTSYRVKAASLKKAPETIVCRYGFILGICALSVMVGCSRYRSDVYTQNAFRASISGQHEVIVRQLNQARTWLTTLDPTSTPLAWYSAMENYRFGHMALARADFASAAKAHPFHFHSLNNAAVLNELAGFWAAADRYREKIEICASQRWGSNAK